MGSSSKKEIPLLSPPPRQQSVLPVKYCEPYCVRRASKKDVSHCTIKESPIFDTPVLVFGDTDCILFRELGKDVVSIIMALLIDRLIKEKFRASCQLEDPWTIVPIMQISHSGISSFCMVYAPYKNASSHDETNTIKNDGVLYNVPNYFWFDEYYYSRRCECHERNARFPWMYRDSLIGNNNQMNTTLMMTRIQ
jgi:hypothetical protein